MESAPKKTLRIKIIFTIVVTTLSPAIISLFLTQDPIFTIIIALISATISLSLLLLFLKPLSSLMDSTHALGQGNFNKRVDIKSGDEFEDVGNSFNLMADKISKIFETTAKEKDIAIAEKSKLDEVLSSLVDGIIALDFNKNIILVNKSAEQITGYTQAELHNQSIDNLIHIFMDTDEILSKTYCQINFNKAARLVGKMGKQIKVNITSAKVDGAVQTNLGCILIIHDLSKEEELERMKLDFISMASHELKTPLTSIIGYLSVFNLENRGKLAKEESDLIDRSLISAQQLLVLVQNILNVNKIERGQMSINSIPTDYLPILSKAVEDLRNQANQKNITLTLNAVDNTLPKILADPLRIGEVITNLVGNAINYTDPGGKVDITLSLSPTEITTEVSDTGVGIPREALPHLFDKFFRVTNKSQQSAKGSGLGLFISKSIIEKLNGKIWAVSELGKGSKFSFTLPVVTQTRGVLDTDKFVREEIQRGALNY